MGGHAAAGADFVRFPNMTPYMRSLRTTQMGIVGGLTLLFVSMLEDANNSNRADKVDREKIAKYGLPKGFLDKGW